jgi:hypothetical protein
MSLLFDTLPSHAPDLIVQEDTSHDPFVVVDKADTPVACTKACNEIDWIPQHLKDLVDQYSKQFPVSVLLH